MHWAGQCLSLLIKNVIKDLTSRKKCIKKKKRCSGFLLASLLARSGFYFCAVPSCLPQKNPCLHFPHVLRDLIAKCGALKTTEKKIIVFESSEISIVLEFLHRGHRRRFVSARSEQKDHSEETFQVEGKGAELGKELCPIPPAPTAASQ